MAAPRVPKSEPPKKRIMKVAFFDNTEEWPVDVTLSQRYWGQDTNAYLHLRKHGYVVIGNIIPKREDRWEATLQFWEWVTRVNPHIDPGDRSTWTDDEWEMISDLETGVCSGHGVAHSDFMKNLRRKYKLSMSMLFVRLYDMLPPWEFVSSLDGCGVYRPWKLQDGVPLSNTPGRTRDPWMHVDFNIIQDAGIESYQGILHLTRTRLDTGGFLVVPGSHRRFEMTREQAMLDPDASFVDMSRVYDPSVYGIAKFVNCEAGDYVVFDSRCLHCNVPALTKPREDQRALFRLCAYITFYPRNKISEEVLEQRRQAYKDRRTLTHHCWKVVVNEVEEETVEMDVDADEEDD